MSAPISISRDTVLHMARLSRLTLTSEETARCEQELAKMMNVFQTLLASTEEYATSSAGSRTSFENVQAKNLRPDKGQNRISAQDFLAQVPEREGAFVRVPAILTPST